MRKIILLVFIVHLFLLSCAVPQVDTAATVMPAEIVSVTVVAPVSIAQTVVPKLTPKHNDLVFVEFFAVT